MSETNNVEEATEATASNIAVAVTATKEVNTLLSQIPLFTAFSSQVASDMAGRMTERTLSAGENIFHQGEVGQELLIIRRGSVKIFLPDSDNPEEAVLAILNDGEFFGELSLLDGQPRSASAVTLRETTLLSLSRDAFYRALHTDYQAVAHVISVLCRRLRATDTRLAESAFRDVRERVAKYLWHLTEHDSETTSAGLRLKTPVSEAELARGVGATAERVRAELNRLSRDLIIAWQGDELTILKPHDLRDMAHGGSATAAITVPDWLLG